MIKNKGVLILTPFFAPNTGGVETHLSDLTDYLNKKKWDIRVITYKPLTTKASAPFFQKVSDNFIIYRIPWFGKTLFHQFEKYPFLQFLYLVPALTIFTFFFLLFHPGKYRVIHAQGFAASLSANILSRFFKVRLISSMHALYGFGSGYVTKACCWILSRFDKVFSMPKPSHQDLLNAGVPDKIIEEYTYWVDQKNFIPLNKKECRAKLRLPQKFTIIFVGRLIEKKGVKILLEVAKQLRDLNFVFVGDGPLEEEFKKEAKRYSNIFVFGRKTPQEINTYYGCADVGVLPSQYEEGFARVTLEALSCGIPVIVANKGCFPGMVNRRVGILIDPTFKNIKEKIVFLYKNPSQLKKLSSKCRNYALQRFSEKNAKPIEASYYW